MPNARCFSSHGPIVSLAFVLRLTLPLPCRAGELRPLEAMPAPNLELPDLSRAMRCLADWRGQVVLLNCWASWCQTCVDEMPGIQRLAGQMQGHPFAVVWVNVAETQKRVARRVEQLGLAFPVLLNAEGETFSSWDGKGLPTSVLIDRSGALRYLGGGASAECCGWG